MVFVGHEVSGEEGSILPNGLANVSVENVLDMHENQLGISHVGPTIVGVENVFRHDGYVGG